MQPSPFSSREALEWLSQILLGTSRSVRPALRKETPTQNENHANHSSLSGKRFDATEDRD
jgi:hypothetical protein